MNITPCQFLCAKYRQDSLYTAALLAQTVAPPSVGSLITLWSRRGKKLKSLHHNNIWTDLCTEGYKACIHNDIWTVDCNNNGSIVQYYTHVVWWVLICVHVIKHGTHLFTGCSVWSKRCCCYLLARQDRDYLSRSTFLSCVFL